MSLLNVLYTALLRLALLSTTNAKSYFTFYLAISPIRGFGLLQLLKNYGKIKEIDFLFHKSGTLQGSSRGFHFVSFYSKQDAQSAITGLNGKQVLSKTLHVRWAHEQPTQINAPVNINLKSDLVVTGKPTGRSAGPTSKAAVIHSIEEKLQDMESNITNAKLEHDACKSTGLHPLLQQSRVNAAITAQKRSHPYKKLHRKRK
ncbi:putative RNA-binding protein 18 isoform X2 [Clavelina lepadiformis]|uniref:putative RNA-binding protein 18 isoform X2 n=1 Tax=Clavelina lepadiformis TaxID=159417 RepID=UPI00404315E7